MIKVKDNWTSRIGLGILIFLAFYILSKSFVVIYLKVKDSKHLKKSSKQLLFEFIAKTAGLIIIFGGAFISLSYVGVDLSTILVVLASAGLGIALALKDFLSSCVNGIVILSLEYFKIGDFVKVGDITGFVHNFNLVTTTIRDTDNIIYIIPNNEIVGKTFINYSKSDNVGVSAQACISNSNPRVNINKILKDFTEIMKNLEYNETPNVGAGILNMNENGTTINCSIYVKPENYGKGLKKLKLALREYLRVNEILLCNMGSRYWIFEEDS